MRIFHNFLFDKKLHLSPILHLPMHSVCLMQYSMFCCFVDKCNCTGGKTPKNYIKFKVRNFSLRWINLNWSLADSLHEPSHFLIELATGEKKSWKGNQQAIFLKVWHIMTSCGGPKWWRTLCQACPKGPISPPPQPFRMFFPEFSEGMEWKINVTSSRCLTFYLVSLCGWILEKSRGFSIYRLKKVYTVQCAVYTLLFLAWYISLRHIRNISMCIIHFELINHNWFIIAGLLIEIKWRTPNPKRVEQFFRL